MKLYLFDADDPVEMKVVGFLIALFALVVFAAGFTCALLYVAFIDRTTPQRYMPPLVFDAAPETKPAPVISVCYTLYGDGSFLIGGGTFTIPANAPATRIVSLGAHIQPVTIPRMIALDTFCSDIKKGVSN